MNRHVDAIDDRVDDLRLGGLGQIVRHLADGEAHPPWRWADTSPIARLEVPRLGVRRVVLAGATGAVLAFGPGHIHGVVVLRSAKRG